MPPAKARDWESLASSLEVLSSPARLDLLHQLRQPLALSDIRLTAERSRQGERPERPLTRQAVSAHLEVLLAAQLIRRIPGEKARTGDRFSLNHERLFAVVDGMRNLSKLRPQFLDDERRATLEHEAEPAHDLPEGPRLLVSYGRDDGRAYALRDGAEWRIGRAPSCEICLDYDPYLSGTHAVVERDANGFRLKDVSSRNGTWVNFQLLPRSGAHALRPGDVVTVGRTQLVFQA